MPNPTQIDVKAGDNLLLVGTMKGAFLETYNIMFPEGSDVSLKQIWQIAPGHSSEPDTVFCGCRAGGALAAIVIAILQGVPKQGLANFNKAVEDWSTSHNPLFGGPNGDIFSMIPFLILMLLLYLVGREVILRSGSGRSARQGPPPSF